MPLPAAPGLTFTCDGKAMPMLPPLCGKAIIASDVAANGKFGEQYGAQQVAGSPAMDPFDVPVRACGYHTHAPAGTSADT